MAVTMLVSVCSVCFGTFSTTVSAATADGLFLKFDDLSGLYATRNVGNQAVIVKDPYNESNNVLKIQCGNGMFGFGNEDGTPYYLAKGKSYKISFKYMYDAGSYDYKVETTTDPETGDKTYEVTAERVLQFQLQYAAADGTGTDGGRQKATAGTQLQNITNSNQQN